MKPLNSILSVGICFILFLPSKSVGQNKFIEYAFAPGTKCTTTHASPVTNGWMIPFNVSDCQDELIAYVNNNTGSIKYLPVLGNGATDAIVYDIIQTGPDEFVCAGFWGKTFDVIGLMSAMIYKMDSSGNVKWETLFGFNSGLLASFTRVVAAPDGSLYALSPDRGYTNIAKTNTNGKKIWQKSFPNIADMVWTSKGLLLSDSSHLILVDTSGAIIKNFNFPRKLFSSLQKG